MGTEGHSALSDKSAISPHYFGDRRLALSPRASAQSPLFSSQILECQGESLPKDSKSISESPRPESRTTSESTLLDSHSVIASAAKQSTESNPHTNLESKADSESPSGEVYPLRYKNKIARSANLEGVALGERKSYERIARGGGGGSELACSGEAANPHLHIQAPPP